MVILVNCILLIIALAESILLIFPTGLIVENKSAIERFKKANGVKNVKFLNLVNFEVHFLDKDEDSSSVKENNDIFFVFNSKLKKYVASANNPQIEEIVSVG